MARLALGTGWRDVQLGSEMGVATFAPLSSGGGGGGVSSGALARQEEAWLTFADGVRSTVFTA